MRFSLAGWSKPWHKLIHHRKWPGELWVLPRLFRDDVKAIASGEDCPAEQKESYELNKSHLWVSLCLVWCCGLCGTPFLQNLYGTYPCIFILRILSVTGSAIAIEILAMLCLGGVLLYFLVKCMCALRVKRRGRPGNEVRTLERTMSHQLVSTFL